MAERDWISLEHVLGSSGRPGADQMLLVAGWVTEALADGHRQGAVHGGLSPRTIGLELGTDGSPVRAAIRPPAEEDADLAAAYAAPEVAGGATPGAEADVYSCGAVLWHCLTGQVPRRGSPPAVTAPEPLAGVLRSMLAETPAERVSAARAADLLAAPAPAGQSSSTREPTQELRPGPAPVEGALPAGASARDRSTGGARRWVGVLSAVVLLLGLSALGWVVWQVVQDEPAGTAATGTRATAPAAQDEADDEGAEDDEGAADDEATGAADDEGTADTVDEAPTTDAPAAPTTAEESSAQEEEDDQPRQITVPPAAELCEDGLEEPYPQVWAGNEVTSCPFSLNVRAAYVEQGDSGADVEVVADSPVTGRTYTMTCEDTAPVRCRGGNAAIVYFGDA